MGTENTAGVILQGAQLTAQANEGLRKSIVEGFGALQGAIKYKSDLMNDMVKATLDVKRTEIDEWYKTENLKLQSRQLDIVEANNKSNIDQKKEYYDYLKTKTEKEASKAPLVSAAKNEATFILEEQKTIQAELENQKLLLTGEFFDKDKNKFIIAKAPLKNGSPEFFQTKNNIYDLQKKLDSNNDRIRRLSSAITAVNLGADTSAVLESISDFRIDGASFQDGSILPDIDEDMLEGQTPQEVYQSPDKNYKGNPFDTIFGRTNYPEFQTNSENKSFKPIVEKPIYASLDEYKNFATRYAAQVDDKNQFNPDVVAQMESYLSDNDRIKLHTERNNIKAGYFNKIGILFARSYTDNKGYPPPKEVVDTLNETYKRNIMSKGESPDELMRYYGEALDTINNAQLEEGYLKLEENDDNVSTKTAYLIRAVNKATSELFKSQSEDTEKNTDPEKEARDAKARKILDEVFININDSFSVEDEIKITRSKLKNDFNSQFLTTRDKYIPQTNEGSPALSERAGVNNDLSQLPVNDKYLQWIAKFKKASDFHITDFVVVGDNDKIQALPDYVVNQRVNIEKNKIINDPEKAYFFWLEKEKKQSAEKLPEYNKYESEVNKFLLNQN